MKKFLALAFALVFLLGFVGLASAADQDQDSLLGTSRADLLKAIGTPDQEITDKKLTASLYESVFVTKDEESGSTYLYFLSKKKTAGFASLDFYAADESEKMIADADKLEKDLSDGGFTLQDNASGEANSGMYYNEKNDEYIYVVFNKLTDGSLLMCLLYTKDQPNLNSMATVIANIDDSLQS